ncbi:MAG: hypothetical protein ACK4NA_09570 [Alphaproteobacteria bacterium]
MLSDVAARFVYLICSLARPDDGFLRLIFAADAVARHPCRDIGQIGLCVGVRVKKSRPHPSRAFVVTFSVALC